MLRWRAIWIFVGCAVCFGIAGGAAWGALSQGLIQASFPGRADSLPSVLVAAIIGGVQGFGGGVVAAVAVVVVVAVVDHPMRLNAWFRAFLAGLVATAAISGYMAWLTRYSSSITTAATYVVPAVVFGLAAMLFAFWCGKKPVSS